MTIKLYELIIENGLPISPFAWRVRYALAHKGLAFEGVPTCFTDIPNAAGGGFKTVPIIEDGTHKVCDSWAIALHLDAAYPDRPLFATPAERGLTALFDNWFGPNVMWTMFGMYVLDIHDQIPPTDRGYFRQSREARFGGRPLEEVVAGREDRLPKLRQALQPMRATLAAQPWLAGGAPGYADYIALGGFLWAAGVATLPPLAADDPLLDWLERGRDLYDGLGRDPRQYPLAA